PQTDSREQARRRAELAKIHVYKQRLSLDDGIYRDVLERVTGLRSAADLDAAQRGQVLDELKRLFMPAPARPRPRPAEHAAPQIALIRGLWADAAMYGLVRSRSEAALRKFARRITGRDALQWLSATDANKVIEGLKAMLARARQGGRQ
ncbi:MAG: phage protein GemA/Gp16 family protein, partial [Candidatus Binataceae bacterium]